MKKHLNRPCNLVNFTHDISHDQHLQKHCRWRSKDEDDCLIFRYTKYLTVLIILFLQFFNKQLSQLKQLNHLRYDFFHCFVSEVY